ncbi:MAG: beta-galactosidase, partial [Deltaproteobacteria bacterium]|nr:beta-galactosidase [Deltaproteobacteria bacterium]MBW2534885.1 beta-galactosidase [Deltaproteobacteria bacterium]
MRRAQAFMCALAVGASYVASADADVGDSSVGMNVHNGTPAFIDASADLGVEWVRMDGNWFSLEPSDESYNWTALDASINDAHSHGLQVFLTLAYTPAWVPRHEVGAPDGTTHNDIPNASTEWVDFVQDAVTHFRSLGVTHFGIWNEPNLDGFLEGGEASLNEYVSIILLPGAQAVRTACGDCKVLGPDLANVGDVDTYLEGLLAQIPTSTFDIFAHHIYQGFPETGVEIWDGDRFFNVLDDQRFKGTAFESLTRRSLRDLLDSWGWTGEVWITETGYQASQIGDATDEATQATYVTRVLEEQLLRDWYTNTFFYEINDCGIDQPTCTIDGFGLMRPTAGSPGSRTFPTDFRLKPAFDAIKQFIANNPSIIGTGPTPECSDGLDNDGDGFSDGADRGCADALDADESDDPPRRRLQALPAGTITVDGDLADFGTEGWVDLTAEDWQSTEPLDSGDLAVRVVGRWSSAGLYLGIEVTDDVHDNSHIDTELWLGDSLQLGFDVAQSGGTGYDAVDDHELNFAFVDTDSQTHAYRFHGPAGADELFEAAVVRSGLVTTYELLLPQSVLPSASFVLDEVIGFSFLINDADGSGREGWMEWSPGIGQAKVPYYFGEVSLQNELVQPDAGTGGTGGTGSGGSAAGGTAGSGASGTGLAGADGDSDDG